MGDKTLFQAEKVRSKVYFFYAVIVVSLLRFYFYFIDEIHALISATASLCWMLLPNSGIRISGSFSEIRYTKMEESGLPGTTSYKQLPLALPAETGLFITPQLSGFFSLSNKYNHVVFALPSRRWQCAQFTSK